MSTIKVKVTREQKRALMEKAADAGRIFRVVFIKKDKSLREMTCKKFVKRHLTYGMHDVRPNPVAHKPEYFTVSDVADADAFRNINLDTLVELKVDGKHYVFEEN